MATKRSDTPSQRKAEQAVIRAAMALRDKQGWIFRYARADAKFQIVDQPKMRRLERTLDVLASFKGKRK